ncbi:MAG: hypothetical protein SPJ83_06850 [Helicobacter sp.]|uniref:hypothetical protein n=1 Tax=Helicobacter sp. TaxID=218 RepID=UPI002A91A825|nr:hypothetical protein [Helicobacter sp.]MDY5822484.1 hypothetical protein [Helicobacter sp.]
METLISVFSVSSVDFVKGFLMGLCLSAIACFYFCKWFVKYINRQSELLLNSHKDMYKERTQELKDLLERQKSIYETQRHIQATNDAAASAGLLKL